MCRDREEAVRLEEETCRVNDSRVRRLSGQSLACAGDLNYVTRAQCVRPRMLGSWGWETPNKL